MRIFDNSTPNLPFTPLAFTGVNVGPSTPHSHNELDATIDTIWELHSTIWQDLAEIDNVNSRLDVPADLR